MVAFTAEHHRAVWNIVDNDWRAKRLLSARDRMTLSEAVIRETETELRARGKSADRREIVRRVKADPEVKRFISVSIILVILIGWIINKILDYLWDNWK